MKFKNVGYLALGCYSTFLSASTSSTPVASDSVWISSNSSDVYLVGNHFNNSNHNHANNNSGGHNNNNHNNNYNHQNYAYNNSSGTKRMHSSSMFC